VPPQADEIEFGRFRLLRRERLLLADGVPVELGARAFDILLALLDANGGLLSKDALLNRVWPDAVVEEGNLQVQIFALRKALGADRDIIRTVPRHGYRLQRDASTADSTAANPFSTRLPSIGDGAPLATPPLGNLPEAIGELIGRDIELQQIVELLAIHRLVTLIGPGGIGKTSLAVAASRQLATRYPDGVWLADLAALTDPDLVPATTAAVLDLRRLPLPLTPDRIAGAIGSRRLLLVLDNCEQVIAAAADLAERLLYGAPGIQLLVTSQEPLRADGERVYRLQPLAVPDPRSDQLADQISRGAVQLFIARARSADARFLLDEATVATIAGICRRLDGMPLAIELAASRAAVLGVDAIAAGLDDRFRLLTAGRRTAMRRHQTLRATLDWSFDLLVPRARTVLCRLAVFAGSFAPAAAEAVAGEADHEQPGTADCIANLVNRSLVILESTPAGVRYRLLETMRAYGLERLALVELEATQRRHLLHYRWLMQRAVSDWEAMPTELWLATYGPEVDNLRAALQWGFAPDGDPRPTDDQSIAADLAAASMPLWSELSLHTECRQWTERALLVADTPGTPREMVLLATYGNSLLNTGADDAEVLAVLQRALTLAEAAGNSEYALRTLYGLWVHFLHANDYAAAYRYAERFHATAERGRDAADRLIGDRMVGATCHYLGQQKEAHARLARVLRQPMPSAQKARESRFGLDQQVATLTAMARVLALLGAADQAAASIEQAVATAEHLDRVASLCHALGEQCVVGLWTGRFEALEPPATRLLALTARYGLRFWRAHALVAQGRAAAAAGRTDTASMAFATALREVGIDRFDLLYPSLTGALAEGHALIGQRAEALALVQRGLSRTAVTGRWYLAELLVLRGELLLARDGSDAEPIAEAGFTQALQHARAQPSLTLELRAATGLSRLMASRGETELAHETLAAVYHRVTEGLDTAYVRAAEMLLQLLAR
jgi:predicted ATPase/DNA-binding winged helix-turn-helix (wHTH) protein